MLLKYLELAQETQVIVLTSYGQPSFGGGFQPQAPGANQYGQQPPQGGFDPAAGQHAPQQQSGPQLPVPVTGAEVVGQNALYETNMLKRESGLSIDMTLAYGYKTITSKIGRASCRERV